MSNETIKPALTPEEWAEALEYASFAGMDEWAWWLLTHRGVRAPQHALGAMCLADQPFGFTWEGHAALRRMLDHAERWLAAHPPYQEEWDALEAARAETQKIAALLPPREPRGPVQTLGRNHEEWEP